IVRQNGDEVGADEIITNEQQWFTGFSRQRISKAVAEIQLRRMPTTLSEVAIGIFRDLSLDFGDWFNGDAGFSHEIVKAPRGDGVAAGIDYNAGFNKSDGTDTAYRRLCNRLRAGQCLGFIAQNGNDRGRIDDHFGRP